MMNAAFREVIAAGDDDRRDLFLTTARRLGTAVENVEKDFCVCWTLDALFWSVDGDGFQIRESRSGESRSDVTPSRVRFA